MAKRSRADTELLLINLQRLATEHPEMTPKQQQDELGISSTNYYNLLKKLKDQGGISKRDMSLADKFVDTQKELSEKTEILSELQAAIRSLDKEVQDAVRAAVKELRRKALEEERQAQIEAIDRKYDAMIEDVEF
jgi:DNA-binding MarR family transcriptional regulator